MKVWCWSGGIWLTLLAGLAQADDLRDTVLRAQGQVQDDVVLFDHGGGKRPTPVLLGARVQAAVQKVRALVRLPSTYLRAVPAFVRADLVSPAVPQDIAWELEIPLWNLKGTLRLVPTERGVDLQLIKGDLAPGLFRLTVEPAPQGQAYLYMDARANLRDANWMTRRLSRRDPLAEAAMTATASWVLLRALALDAESVGVAALRRPRSPMASPPTSAIDGRTLASLVAASIGPRQMVARIRSRPDGRLGYVEIARLINQPTAALAAVIDSPGAWRALPGWSSVTEKSTGSSASRVWQVDASLPFVDFDSIWRVTRTASGMRAQALPDDDWTGAVMGWDLLPGSSTGTTVCVYTLHPRIENTGYLPRRLVQAEPLLEHGLALGLAYVNALALTGRP